MKLFRRFTACAVTTAALFSVANSNPRAIANQPECNGRLIAGEVCIPSPRDARKLETKN